MIQMGASCTPVPAGSTGLALQKLGFVPCCIHPTLSITGSKVYFDLWNLTLSHRPLTQRHNGVVIVDNSLTEVSLC
jgi:hypothetical protein